MSRRPPGMAQARFISRNRADADRLKTALPDRPRMPAGVYLFLFNAKPLVKVDACEATVGRWLPALSAGADRTYPYSLEME